MSKNVIVIAGPNGCGKSTFVNEYLRYSESSVYISADAETFEMEVYNA